MKIVTKQHGSELLIYGALWAIVLLAPIVDVYMKASNSGLTFSWSGIWEVWCDIVPYFILFLIHNFILAPRLLLVKKTALYVVSVVCVLFVFHLFQWYGHPLPRRGPAHIPMQMEGQRPLGEKEAGERIVDFPPEMAEGKPDWRPDRKPDRKPEGRPLELGRKPNILFFPDIVSTSIAALMLGFNVAVKLFFKSHRDEAALKELEHQNLQQELEYLKYQINPHFFMNTLNNIHALVDIDAEKAKTTILELSKLMRYMLYEGSNRMILLSREIEFLKNYIALMRLRFTDKVKIETEMSVDKPDVLIPPLLFVSFVENAFKHGVSYQMDSFIRISMYLQGGKLSFRCLNSKCKKNSDPYSGIGLENVRKRLKLLYGDDYTLHLEDGTNTFDVLLIIPVNA